MNAFIFPVDKPISIITFIQNIIMILKNRKSITLYKKH